MTDIKRIFVLPYGAPQAGEQGVDLANETGEALARFLRSRGYRAALTTSAELVQDALDGNGLGLILIPSVLGDPAERWEALTRLWEAINHVRPQTVGVYSADVSDEIDRLGLKSLLDCTLPAKLSSLSPPRGGRGLRSGAPPVYDLAALRAATSSGRGNLLEAYPHLSGWVDAVVEAVARSTTEGQPDDRVSHPLLPETSSEADLSRRLAKLAVDIHVGRELGSHQERVFFSALQGGKAELVFAGWCEALREFRPTKRPVNVAVLDDMPSVIEEVLLPNWFWQHSNFRFYCDGPVGLQDTLDCLTSIDLRKRSRHRFDAFLIDIDWRHAEKGRAGAQDGVNVFPDQEDKEYEYREQEHDEVVTKPLTNLQSYLVDLVLRYNEQFRFSELKEAAENWDWAHKTDEELGQIKEKGKREGACARRERARVGLKSFLDKYCSAECADGGHEEGIVAYHYVKAFDEFFPTVVFTSDVEDSMKLRQTAGLNTEFVTKQDLVRGPKRLLKALQTVMAHSRRRTRTRHSEDARACRKLIGKGGYYDRIRKAVPLANDYLVKKTKTRVLALLELEVDGKTKCYFGRNFELSQPTGSMCSERSAIAQALALNPKLRVTPPQRRTQGRYANEEVLDEFRLLVVLGDEDNEKRGNPCPSCGVCAEWIRKLTKMDTVMLSRDLKHFCYYPRDDRIAY